MNFPTIKPTYTSVGVECNENKLLCYDTRPKKNDLSILRNAYFNLNNTKVNKGVFYIKKRINLMKPKDNKPTYIHDKANFVKYMEECTVSNFNNKYNCWLYLKNKSLFDRTDDDYNPRYTKRIQPILGNFKSVNKTLIDLSVNKTENNRLNVNDKSIFEKVKEMSSKRKKISINCIKEITLLKEI